MTESRRLRRTARHKQWQREVALGATRPLSCRKQPSTDMYPCPLQLSMDDSVSHPQDSIALNPVDLIPRHLSLRGLSCYFTQLNGDTSRRNEGCSSRKLGVQPTGRTFRIPSGFHLDSDSEPDRGRRMRKVPGKRDLSNFEGLLDGISSDDGEPTEGRHIPTRVEHRLRVRESLGTRRVWSPCSKRIRRQIRPGCQRPASNRRVR